MIINFENIDKVVVQHNRLINGRVHFSTNELRIFLYMLLKIKKQDMVFRDIQIPCAILHGQTQKVNYDQIKAAANSLTSKSYEVEKVSKTGKRNFESYPLMAYCKYNEGEGMVLARFNEHIKPYLLNLSENFTTAQFKQFMNITSFSSWQIYWLLKQYEDFGVRTFELEELKFLLGVDDKYNRFNDFKRKVLLVCQEDLDKTDMTFDFEVIRKSKRVDKIKFRIIKNKPQLTVPHERRRKALSDSSQATIDFNTKSATVDKNLEIVREKISQFDLSKNEQKKILAYLHANEIENRIDVASKNNDLLKIAQYFKDVI